MNLIKTLLMVSFAILTANAYSASYVGTSIFDRKYLDDAEETGAVVYKDSIVRTLDFTLDLGSEYSIGALIDLDEDQERSQNILVNLGVGDWVASIMKGKVKGVIKEVGEEHNHAVQPPVGEFEHQYDGVRIFQVSEDSDALMKYGIVYSHWKKPTLVELDTRIENIWGNSREKNYIWIDPATEYSLLGLYISRSKMTSLTKRGASSGFGYEFDTELGLHTVKPSGFGKDFTDSEATNKISYDSVWGYGGSITGRYGYYNGFRSDEFGFTFALGLEAGGTVMVIGSGSSENITDEVVPASDTLYYGPFASFMARF